MRFIVVTGTGTEIGKTITSAMLVACALRLGQRVALVKPVQTGVLPGEAGDADEVRRLTGLADVHELVRYDEPLAPATAARRLGDSGPALSALADSILGLRDRDLVIIEGAGGSLVRFNAMHDTILDLATLLQHRLGAEGAPDSVEILVTTTCRLGTLHSSAATCAAIRSHGLDADHLVIADWPMTDPGLAELCNIDDLPDYCATPLHGLIMMGAGQLDRHQFERQAAASLTPHLGGTWDPAGFGS